MEGDAENAFEQQKPKKHKGKHDKPKPWDDPSIDHWKIDKFEPSWNEGGMLETSFFDVLFPQYRGTYNLPVRFSSFHNREKLHLDLGCKWTRVACNTGDSLHLDLLSGEKYLQEAWPMVKRALKEHGIVCELDLVKGVMSVKTTKKTRDPYIIIKAKQLMELLARSVPAPQALKILDDEMQCDIIKIGNLTRSKERFVKRRQHLLGPNSSTLKAIEILTGCYVLIQGNTVAAMGPFKGLKQVRRIAEDCITNTQHPIYHIKTLLMKRELAKNPALANENWDRFLPKFKKKNVKQKKAKSKEKKPYTPFPPPQQPSKVDLQLESGEYFLSDQKKLAKKWQEKQEKQAEKTAENKRKREAAFIPPKEDSNQVASQDSTKSAEDDKSALEALAKSVKEKSRKLGKRKAVEDINAESYIAAPEKQRPKKKSS